jgi:chorismate mutase
MAGLKQAVKFKRLKMATRGVRGATCAAENTKEALIDATRALLTRMIEANGIAPEDIASAFFSTTPDLTADFPAIAARQLGWRDVPLMCMHEMNVPNALPMCVRVMMHWNTEKHASDIRHVYINGAEKLRPDLIREG